MQLSFVLQYASYLYCSTPSIRAHRIGANPENSDLANFRGPVHFREDAPGSRSGQNFSKNGHYQDL